MNRIAGMRAFLDVVDAGGFAAASRAGSASVAVNSKRLRQLEEHLGVQLVHRTTRSIALTDAGERYLVRCRQILELLDESEDLARQDTTRLRGRLRIAMPPGFAARHGSALIAGFSTAHPEIELDVRVSVALLDLVASRIDVAIRLTRPADSELIARRVAPAPLVLVASAPYLDAHGTPQHPADLAHHATLQDSNLSFGSTWPLVGPAGPEPMVVRPRLQADTPLLVLDLARAHCGIALLPRLLAEPDLASGRLVEVLPGQVDAGWSVYLVTVRRRLLPRRTTAFVDWVRAALAAPAPSAPAD